ncbi:MAG: hypothetical protein ACR2FJ_05430 [Qipengyuania sp.]
MFRLAAQLIAAFAALAAAPAAAQSFTIVSAPVIFVASPTVQSRHAGKPIAPAEYAPASHRVAHIFTAPPPDLPKWRAPQQRQPAWRAPAGRLVAPHRVNYNHGIADYGPFRVIDETRIALVGETDARSPQWFARLLQDYPDVARLDMVECPGTLDDRANMRLGRMIRRAGLATHVPAFGSVRSGAVELFLAGVHRSIEEGAEFAVHSWRDAWGREAGDFAADARENRSYIDYYREMGMSLSQARAFYDMTNSVPHHRARWLEAHDMRPWVAGVRETDAAPRIAYLEVGVS